MSVRTAPASTPEAAPVEERRPGLFRGIPRAARWCALVAFLNAAVWACVTPIFHVPDETSHVAYLQYLAETGLVPNIPGGDGISRDEARIMDAVRFNDTLGYLDQLAPATETQQREIDFWETNRDDPTTGGGIIQTSGQPPLYYALGSVIYHASPWKGLTERILLIRLLLSALCAAATTLFVFMFLRELFAEPWTWTVGALAVAFQPMAGFVAGGVHPDNLFFAASAALLFGLARAFRRGLTPALGAGIGAALAVGALAKLNFVALVPGVLVGLLLLAWRSRERRASVQGAAIAVGILALAVAAYAVLNAVAWDRAILGGGVETATNAAVNAGSAPPISLKEQLGFTWQLYLPRLPFMYEQFPFYFPPYEVWFQGTIGRFGWLDTEWPLWVYRVALAVFVVLAVLAACALWARRRLLPARWPELLTYAVIVAGVLGSIGFLGIRFKRDTGFDFAQARYLFPFLAFYGAFVVLAALGAGRRFARPVGAALVLLAMTHGLLGQLLVISRFYA